MKYFYLTAEGVTAGPESLETLCAMMAGGAVSLATLVVPAGGEDWTPLARVLRYFYQDAAGATAGPVAFSELDRLCQIHAIPAGAWVVEESGTDWKTAAAVLGAGGVAVALATPAPRVVHATYRPQTATAGNPYAAPHAAVGQRVVVRHRATGGLGRLWFIVNYLVLVVLSVLLLLAFFVLKSSDRSLSAAQFDRLVTDFVVVYLTTLAILVIGGTWLTVLRIQNIGWPRALALLTFGPSVGAALGGLLHVNAPWFYLILGLVSIFAFIFQISLLILPPGFARHKRLDTAAWIILAVLVLLIAGTVTFGMTRKRPVTDENPASPAPAAGFIHTGM